MKLRTVVSVLVATAVCGFLAPTARVGAQGIPPVPAVSVAPVAPAAPTAPAAPASPAAPVVPVFPADWRGWNHRHSVSISDGHNRPISDCSDLHIRFDDRDAVIRSEERTIPKAQAPVLRVRPHTNGGMQVQGWDKDVYSVTACKAAASSGGDAERILSQISLSVQGGEVSTKGPSDDEDWTVYLLIRAPKSATIDGPP